ncbi:MAG: class I SAM-dependent methyltransferase [Candidatus Bathyarchaeia archaeon]|jgi:hypothetical protein
MDKIARNENSGTCNCALCGSSDLRIFYTAKNVPASCNRLWKNKDDALNCPKGDIKLAFCRSCTFISNIAIEPEKNQYDSGYDNSLFYSAHFQEFARKLTSKLVEQYGLYNKNIVEIGGGKVDFLSSLKELGKNCAFRFNPFYPKFESSNQEANSPLSSITRSFPFLDEGKKVDFVFSYHELEHMNNPKILLKYLWMLLDKSTSPHVFFSVPNALKAFEEGDYSDIIYEHVSYFTIPSLHFLFSLCGFEISSVQETRGEIFDSIHVDATRKQGKMPNLNPISELAIRQIDQIIQKFYAKTLENIRKRSQQLTKLLDKGNRIVIWGAGARGVTFLNILKDQRIKYAVDINPHKHGMYVPGTGQKIVVPEFLLDYRPDFIILANPAYKKEIELLVDSLGIVARYLLI